MAKKGHDQSQERFTEYDVRVHRVDTIGKTVGKIVPVVVKYAVLALCVMEIADVLIHWTGEHTRADVNVAMDVPGLCASAIVLAGTFGFLGIVYGRKQAKLRRNTISRLNRRLEKEEAEIDPQRSSSGLTRSGDTPSEDNPNEKV